jgi:hypothetical protein
MMNLYQVAEKLSRRWPASSYGMPAGGAVFGGTEKFQSHHWRDYILF